MRVSLTVLSLLALGAACIPSHRLVHDGNRYFEHCYGADFDPGLAARQKEACWQAWLAHYTRHQPAQRVDYALRRVEAFQSGEPVLTLPGFAADAPAPRGDGQLGDGQLASLGRDPARMPAAATDGGVSPVPNGCVEACSAYEGRCVSQCPERNVSCRHVCTRERTICLDGCH